MTGETARARLGTWLIVAACIGGVLAVFAFVTGGFRVHVLGVPVSVRGGHRAALVSVLLGVTGLWLHAGLRRRFEQRVRSAPASMPAWIAAAATLTVLAIGLTDGTKAAGGSDVYGYVSQAYLYRSGALRVPLPPVAAAAPWPDAHWTFAPLAYRPGENLTIVPTYAPGIPLLMAALMLLFGPGAEYWVTPLCGAALVWLAYLVGTHVGGRAVGASSALIVASSPIVVLMTCWLLGDLPGATFWMLSIWLALRSSRSPSSVLLAGLATAVAIVIRPNLAPVSIVPLILIFRLCDGTRIRDRITACVTFVVALLPGPLYIAWLFNELHGSPFRSGYGDNSALFSLSYVPRNLSQFLAWSGESHGPFIFLFPLSLVFAMRSGSGWHVRAALIAFITLVWGCYIAYIPFDAWWFMRFLLPAVPVMLLLGSDAVWQVAARLGDRSRYLALALYTIVAVSFGMYRIFTGDLLSIGKGERRYEQVGTWVKEHLPANAVVYCMQNSGNIRHYSGRLTIRIDYLAGDWLDRSVAFMRQSGYEPYFVFEDWEIAQARERFSGQQSIRVFDEPSQRTEIVHRSFALRIP